MYKYQICLFEIPEEYFHQENLEFKPQEFSNPISKGDEIQLGEYHLGTVDNIYHIFRDGVTQLGVKATGQDIKVFFNLYRKKESGLEDLVESE